MQQIELSGKKYIVLKSAPGQIKLREILRIVVEDRCTKLVLGDVFIGDLINYSTNAKN